MKAVKSVLVLVVVVLVAVARPAAGLSFATALGDHMVLQSAPAMANVWGFCDAGCGGSLAVTVTPDNKPATLGTQANNITTRALNTTTDVWLATLPSFDAGSQGFVIEVVDGRTNQTASLSDVVFGEVWVCGGQSNMEFLLNNSFTGPDEISTSTKFPDIRVFTIERATSGTPQLEAPVKKAWARASPDSLLQVPDGKEWDYFSAVCWFYAKAIHEQLGVPVGAVDTTWGGTVIEHWSPPSALEKCHTSQSYAGDMYNSMVHPLMNMTVRGVVWYQGESNRHEPALYNCTFPAMVAEWRSVWTASSLGNTPSDMPFGFVQIADFSGDVYGFPGIRWAQTTSLGYVPNDALPHTFMVVAMDLGDHESPFTDIHSRYKKEVGQRLFNAAMAEVYDHKIAPYKGPIASSAKVLNSTCLRVRFDLEKDVNDHPLALSLRNASLAFWELCDAPASPQDSTDAPCVLGSSVCTLGSSTGWNGATTTGVVSTNEMDICSSDAKLDDGGCVRYAWRAWACEFEQCALYGGDLPVSTFVLRAGAASVDARAAVRNALLPE